MSPHITADFHHLLRWEMLLWQFCDIFSDFIDFYSFYDIIINMYVYTIKNREVLRRSDLFVQQAKDTVSAAERSILGDRDVPLPALIRHCKSR